MVIMDYGDLVIEKKFVSKKSSMSNLRAIRV